MVDMEQIPVLTAAYLAGKIDEYVKQSARDTIISNAKRDKYARYARVPDGGACDWCEMLGSRGYVYHSEDSADAAWHPHCNCQIAVAFEPVIDEYYAGWTKVTRGYADEAFVMKVGANGVDELYDVDIDVLYERYLKAGKSFNKNSTFRDYSAPTKLSPESFNAAMKRLANAQTVEELHRIGDEIVRNWPKSENGRDSVQWNEMCRHAKALEQSLKAKKAS